MSELKWVNWNKGIEMKELKWRNWNEWIEWMNAGRKEGRKEWWNEWMRWMNDLKWMTWNEWVEVNYLTLMNCHSCLFEKACLCNRALATVPIEPGNRGNRPSFGDHGSYSTLKNNNLLHFPTTWWWCGCRDDWDDDVVAMMARQLAS